MTFIPQMTSSFHPHIFLLRFSTKTVGKEAKARKIITRYHEVSRRRLWYCHETHKLGNSTWSIT